MSSNETLEELRRQIDAIDDRIHDLLIERSGMIEQIVAAKRDGQAKLRPGREALIARRLVGRHRGRFPPASLIRIWREIINAFTCMQGPFDIALPAPDVDPVVWELARDYFGGTPGRHRAGTAGAALRAVAADEATLAVLPWGEGRSGWVGALLALDDPGLRICYGLPFVRGAAGETTAAVAVGRIAAEPTGSDRGVLAIGAASRAAAEAALRELEFEVVGLWPMAPGHHGFLAEVGAAVQRGDPRLGASVTALGSYAEPIVLAETGGIAR